MKEEIFKDIEGYEGLYEVSNRGNMKSLNYRRTGKERILKPQKNRCGYLQVQLWKDGKAKNYLVHRLVAEAFIPNTDNLPQVNHIDENKQNNCMDNLEWCSRSYNLTYNDRAKKAGKKQSKPVLAIDKVTGLIVEFASVSEASRVLRIDQGNITKCCQGKYKSMGGFYWYYADTIE